MNNKYTHEEVKAKLRTGKYYLKSLPSYQCSNFGMFYSKRHGKYYRSNVSLQSNAIGDIYDVSNEEIDEFLVKTSHTDGYKDYHFDEIANMHQSLHQLEDLVGQAEEILLQMEENQTLSFRFSSLDFYLMSMDMFDWYAISEKENGHHYEFMMNSNRARKEVVNVLQERPNETCREQLPPVAKKRWKYVSQWVSSRFTHGKKPGVYYLINSNAAIAYLSNGHPVEITFDDSKQITSLLQNLYGKHQDYLKQILKYNFQVTVLEDIAQTALQGLEYLNLDEVFKVEVILSLLNSEKLYLKCGPFHQSNYGVTADKTHLHSHTLNKDYPIAETLAKLLKEGGAVYLSGFEEGSFPASARPTSISNPSQESLPTGGGAADDPVEVAHQHLEAPIVEVKPYEVSQKWDLKIIKAQCRLTDYSLKQLLELEVQIALELHEAITSVSLSYKGQEQAVDCLIKTYSLGSRVLTSKAVEKDGVITTVWNYESFPDDVMLTLKTIINPSFGLQIEINAFVSQRIFDKITDSLDAIFISG